MPHASCLMPHPGQMPITTTEMKDYCVSIAGQLACELIPQIEKETLQQTKQILTTALVSVVATSVATSVVASVTASVLEDTRALTQKHTLFLPFALALFSLSLSLSLWADLTVTSPPPRSSRPASASGSSLTSSCSLPTWKRHTIPHRRPHPP